MGQGKEKWLLTVWSSSIMALTVTAKYLWFTDRYLPPLLLTYGDDHGNDSWLIATQQMVNMRFLYIAGASIASYSSPTKGRLSSQWGEHQT
jgi:hypothetical protein